MSARLRNLTTEEQAQLRSYAATAGRKWRDELLYTYWMRGEPIPGFPLIYGLRNSHGPSWLTSYRFPKVSA